MKIDNVGFNGNSLVKRGNIITGSAVIYSYDKDDTYYDSASFMWNPKLNRVDVLTNPEAKFTKSEIVKIEEILLDNLTLNVNPDKL